MTGPAPGGRPDPVLAFFDHTVTAADLCSEPYLVAPDDDVTTVVRALSARGYAAAPVRSDTSHPTGVRVLDVTRTRPGPSGRSGTVRVADRAEPLPGEALVGPAATLPVVVAALGRHGLVVVVEQPGGVPARITGVITARDLDRAVARLAVLGLILWLEPNLDRLVHDHAGDGWPDLLTPSRRQRLGSVRPAVQRPGAGLRAMEVLNLDDRLTLVRRLPDLRRRLGWASTGEFRRFAEPLRRMRDSLAHGGGLVDAAGGPAAAVALVVALRDLAGRVEAILAGPGQPLPVSGGRTRPATP